MSRRPKMVGWYNPPHLISIAIRVAISTVFGELADRREFLAADRKIDPHKFDGAYDYRDRPPPDGQPHTERAREDFWFDFVADTGDGWNPTYAIARLLAEQNLAVKGVEHTLPRGRILLMGGDEVYPTASREEYEKRLVAPYEEAARGKIGPVDPPDVYAIPGNHDWYDGLLAFLGRFCRRRASDEWAVSRDGRIIGGRRTQQTRSYFALALPGDWWLWGADVQLAGYVDQPQIDFFTHVASEWMQPGSKLILCTGMPSWAYVDVKNPEPAFKNFSYLEGIADGKNHQLRVVLTGDSHYYSRYVESGCQYITAGGGGAFLHPTHKLEDKQFGWKYPAPGSTSGALARHFVLAKDSTTGAPSLFPDRSTSLKLSFRNLGFAFLNPQYALTLGFVCAFFAWLLQSQARYTGTSLLEVLAPQPLPDFATTVSAYLGLVFISPWPITLVLLVAGGYYYLADFSDGWPRLLAGALHTVVQTVSVMLATCLLARHMAGWPDWSLIVAVGVVGGFIAATVLGIYFMVCLNLLGKHWNEAFSALRIENYKCFLRLRISSSGTLSIYPIGLTNVPRDDDGSKPPANPKLCPHLIEQPVDVA